MRDVHHSSPVGGRKSDEARWPSLLAAAAGVEGGASVGARKPETPGNPAQITAAAHTRGRWRTAAILRLYDAEVVLASSLVRGGGMVLGS
jgi:hypothetical protein